LTFTKWGRICYNILVGDIMFKNINILDEKNKCLRDVSKDTVFPVPKHEKELIKSLIKYLKYSQIEKFAEQYDIRPGMGLAFPQLGIPKRLIIIVHEYESGNFKNYVIVNPKIISHSEELIAAEVGEGCLSVNREIEGHVIRFARITVEGFDLEGNPLHIRAREELAIAIQHEVDHLNGILFFDRIDKKQPFVTDKSVRLI
jgi:peptide deformylase